MQKYGWRFFPVIPTGARQTYQTRAGAMGNYGVVDLEYKKQILLWACPTPTKGNCWCCLRTAGGVPTPHGSAVESHWVSLFFLLHFRIGLVLTVMFWLFILLQTPTLFIGGQMYCWILHINKISIVGCQKKKTRIMARCSAPFDRFLIDYSRNPKLEYQMWDNFPEIFIEATSSSEYLPTPSKVIHFSRGD